MAINFFTEIPMVILPQLSKVRVLVLCERWSLQFILPLRELIHVIWLWDHVMNITVRSLSHSQGRQRLAIEIYVKKGCQKYKTVMVNRDFWHNSSCANQYFKKNTQKTGNNSDLTDEAMDEKNRKKNHNPSKLE